MMAELFVDKTRSNEVVIVFYSNDMGEFDSHSNEINLSEENTFFDEGTTKVLPSRRNMGLHQKALFQRASLVASRPSKSREFTGT